MSARIAYFRVSTKEQSIQAQRGALGESFDKEFQDEGVSGAVLAADRPGFSAMLNFVREGDTVFVYAVDRLGRDAIDVQQTVQSLIDKGVSVHVHGLGLIAKGVGELIIAVLAQVASMERARIVERCEAGRAAARASLATSGKTHRGKDGLGRPKAHDAKTVHDWRKANGYSLSKTAEHFGLSLATVKRYCAAHGDSWNH